MSEIVAVDLFCGVGGLTYGLESAGINVVAGVDADEACRYPYEANTDSCFLHRDIEGVSGDGIFSGIANLDIEELRSRIPDDAITAVVGCAPCQPFSNLSNIGDVTDHDKSNLLPAMREIVEELEPELFAMENVPPLYDESMYTDDFRGWFDNHTDYHVWDGVVDCTEYLIPQSRQRLVMLASRFGEIERVPYTRTEEDIVSVRRAFADYDIPEIEAGGWDRDYHPLHKAAGLQSQNKQRMRHTKEGEDWHDLPDNLQPPSQEDSSHTAYGRMWWDKPAPTLTTNLYNWGSGRFGHPGYSDDEEESVDRAISFFEGAILQTFPEDYKFIPEGERPRHDLMGRLIGNAVPVRLAAAIGGSLRRHLDHHEIEVEYVDLQQDNNSRTDADYTTLVPLPQLNGSLGDSITETDSPEHAPRSLEAS